MIRTKAIEILELNLKVGEDGIPPDVKDAINLGVAALLFVETLSHVSYPTTLFKPPVLPGEDVEKLDRLI